MDVLLRERRGPVLVLTMNRPERRNALSVELLQALDAALAAVDTADGLRAVVLTGTDPAWCAGLDLHEIAEGGHGLGAGESVAERLRTLAVPVIAAVNGAAVTGGLELCLACAIRIGSERARFADTHARIGIHPGWGLTAMLPRIVGPARARLMSFTGDQVGAEEALRWGLLERVVPHAELVDAAVALGEAIAGVDAGMLGTVRALYDVTDDGLAPALQRETTGFRAWRETSDTAATVAARKDDVIARGRALQRGGATPPG